MDPSVYYNTALEGNILPPQSESDTKQGAAMWQQDQYLSDSGLVSGSHTGAPSVSSKQGPDEIEYGINGSSVAPMLEINKQISRGEPGFISQPSGMAVEIDNNSVMPTVANTVPTKQGPDDVGFGINDVTVSAIPKLTELLAAEDQVVVAQASMMVMELSRSSNCREAMSINQPMMTALINALRTSEDTNVIRRCAGTIHNLSHFPNGLAAIFNLQGVTVLCKLLRHPREIVKYVAIATLHNLLLSHKGAKNAARMTGGIEIMTSLLQYDNVKFLAVCVDCLQMLTYGHKPSKLVLLESGAPAELIRIMQSYTYEKLLYTTTRLLKVLSVCPQNKPRLVQCGCVQILATHLASSSDRLVYNCLWTLRNLSDVAYKCEGLELLLQMLCELLLAHKVEMTVCAVGILSNLLCNNQKNKTAMCEMGGVECLLRCLAGAGDRDSVTEMAICALRHLTNRHLMAEAAQTTILNVGGLPVIMKLMQPTSKWSLIKAAVGLIRNLALCPSNATQLREHGAFQHIVQIFMQVFKDMQLQITYSDVKIEDIAEDCIAALQVLCQDVHNRSLLIRQNATPVFVQLLRSSNENIQRAVSGVLSELAGDREGVQEMLAGGANHMLSQLSLSHNEAVATNAAIALSRLPAQNCQSFNFSSSLFPEVLPWENSDEANSQANPSLMPNPPNQQNMVSMPPSAPVESSNDVNKVMFNFSSL